MLQWSRDMEVRSQLHWNNCFAITFTEPGFYPCYLLVGLRTSFLPQVKCLQRSPRRRLKSFVHLHICKNLLNTCACKVSPHYWSGNQVTRSLTFSWVLMSSCFSLLLCQQSCIFDSKSLSFNILCWNMFSPTQFYWLVVRHYAEECRFDISQIKEEIKDFNSPANTVTAITTVISEPCSIKYLSLNSTLWISKVWKWSFN